MLLSGLQEPFHGSVDPNIKAGSNHVAQVSNENKEAAGKVS